MRNRESAIVCALLIFAACGKGGNSGVDDGWVSNSGMDFVNFNESFVVGPRPVSVLIVRHAQPTDLELDYSMLVADAWLEGLEDHDAPWRLAVLPIGADDDILPKGALAQTDLGQKWAEGTMADPGAVIDELLQPIDGSAPSDNPVFTTISTMTNIGANEAFFLENSLFVIHVVSMYEDTSDPGADDDLEDWLREDTEFGWAATEFNASTNLSGSECVGGEANDLLGMVAAIGGFQQDICDGTGPSRAAGTYTASMTSYEMTLSAPAYPFSIEVTSSKYLGPALELDEDFRYNEDYRKVTLLSWQPEDLTSIWVRYVPIL